MMTAMIRGQHRKTFHQTSFSSKDCFVVVVVVVVIVLSYLPLLLLFMLPLLFKLMCISWLG